MANDDKACPQCQGKLAYVKEGPQETSSSGDKIIVTLASSIYRCPTHGLWRFYISGAVEPYREPAQS